MPHLPACFFSRLDLPEDFPTPRLLPTEGSSLAKLRSLRQSPLRKNRLLLPALSHGFVASGFFARGSAFS